MQFLKQSAMQRVNGAILILKGVESEVVENASSWARDYAWKRDVLLTCRANLSKTTELLNFSFQIYQVGIIICIWEKHHTIKK